MWPSRKKRSASEDQEQPLGPDADTIRKLALLLTECGLSEIAYWVCDCCLRVARSPSPDRAVAATEIIEPADKTPTPGLVLPWIELVSSPEVGFPQLVNELDGEPFVRIGDIVRKGQVLLYIDVLKIMQPVVAPCDGRIVDVLIQGPEGVGYGAPLMIIEQTELSPPPSIP